MWNKKSRILWFHLQLEGTRCFYLSFPISLYVFMELLDCILDILEFINVFIPNKTNENSPSTYSLPALIPLVSMTMELINSLTQDEPYDLLDVAADQIKVSFKLR